MSIRDVVTTCDSLRAVLVEIDAGRMDASTVLRARIEGAVVALDVLLGADVTTVLDRLAETPDTHVCSKRPEGITGRGVLYRRVLRGWLTPRDCVMTSGPGR